jgi:hypothetical protein
MTIDLSADENMRLRLEAYLAITANTVQFRARMELFAHLDPFTLDGLLACDTLFQFSPFQFEALVEGMVALRQGTELLAGAHLKLAVSGPAPWRAQGTALFELCGVQVTVPIDVTVGDTTPFTPPTAENFGELMLAAAQDLANWTAALPSGEGTLVTLAAGAAPQDDELLAHPLGDLVFRQRVAPSTRPSAASATAR